MRLLKACNFQNFIRRQCFQDLRICELLNWWCWAPCIGVFWKIVRIKTALLMRMNAQILPVRIPAIAVDWVDRTQWQKPLGFGHCLNSMDGSRCDFILDVLCRVWWPCIHLNFVKNLFLGQSWLGSLPLAVVTMAVRLCHEEPDIAELIRGQAGPGWGNL